MRHVTFISCLATALFTTMIGGVLTGTGAAVMTQHAHRYHEATMECEARCDPYQSRASFTTNDQGVHDCECSVPPGVVHDAQQSRAQALLDSITSEPEQGWTVGK